MQTLRQIKARIKSIANTRKITSAMQLVSAAKLSRSKAAFHSYRVYVQHLDSMLKNFAADIGTVAHPLLEEREDRESIALCVIASDSGLCGNYNYNVMSAANVFLNAHKYQNIKVIAIGREAVKFFKKKGVKIEKSILDLHGKYNPRTSDEITRMLIEMFVSQSIAEAYIIHTRFSPTLRHGTITERFLPIQKIEGGEALHYLMEPDGKTILDELISQYLMHKIRSVMLEAFTCEHSARMYSMKTATDNADELIDMLTLQRNKARQAAITQEVTEIAMSAEALKG